MPGLWRRLGAGSLSAGAAAVAATRRAHGEVQRPDFARGGRGPVGELLRERVLQLGGQQVVLRTGDSEPGDQLAQLGLG